MADTPQTFSEKMQGLLGVTPFWIAPTKPAVSVSQFSDPEKPAYIIGSPDEGGFSKAVKAALSAANPFQPTNTATGAVAAATRPVAEGAGEMLKAGADATRAAGRGITSGFKWAVMILIFGLAAYAFLLAAPFLPRPAGGGPRG